MSVFLWFYLLIINSSPDVYAITSNSNGNDKLRKNKKRQNRVSQKENPMPPCFFKTNPYDTA